jgi:hypothetical protein
MIFVCPSPRLHFPLLQIRAVTRHLLAQRLTRHLPAHARPHTHFLQNLDSSEISLTDVSHYFDSDPTKIVQGLRKDGKAPSAYIADTTTANAQVGDGRCDVVYVCYKRLSRLPTFSHSPSPSGPLCNLRTPLCRCAQINNNQ